LWGSLASFGCRNCFIKPEALPASLPWLDNVSSVGTNTTVNPTSGPNTELTVDIVESVITTRLLHRTFLAEFCRFASFCRNIAVKLLRLPLAQSLAVPVEIFGHQYSTPGKNSLVLKPYAQR
jgi:hypothetical protein